MFTEQSKVLISCGICIYQIKHKPYEHDISIAKAYSNMGAAKQIDKPKPKPKSKSKSKPKPKPKSKTECLLKRPCFKQDVPDIQKLCHAFRIGQGMDVITPCNLLEITQNALLRTLLELSEDLIERFKNLQASDYN